MEENKQRPVKKGAVVGPNTGRGQPTVCQLQSTPINEAGIIKFINKEAAKQR